MFTSVKKGCLFPKKDKISAKIPYLCTANSNLLTFKPQFIMSEIASRVKAIIVDKLGVDENQVTESASFTTDLGADSLDTVELIVEFEKEFDIRIPDNKAEEIKTVGDAIAYIENPEA